MTIINRESFLSHLQERLGRSQIQDVQKPIWKNQAQKHVQAKLQERGLIESFKEHLKKIHTSYYETDPANLPTVLTDLLQTIGKNRFIISWDERLKEYGLLHLFEELKQKGKEIHFWSKEGQERNLETAKASQVGITFSDITLAESGTVTLFNNQNNGRSISLLPEIHICLIEESTLVPRLTDAANLIQERIEAGHQIPSCVSLISGPSNSADIEMKLIVGVHGPVQAIYILIKGV